MSHKILLLSAYDALSHKLWRERLLAMFPDFEWTQLVLPPRQFNWRIRGNSLQWALTERETLSQDYKLLIATSMVDLASLRGFVPKLCQIPNLLYFHENQFVYPAGNQQRSSNVEPQLVPLYSAYCADKIIFNSHYNRSTFLQGCAALLERLPDRLGPELLDKLEHSQVVPVPLPDTQHQETISKAKNWLDIVWNHRWEYDKGPKLLLQLVEQITAQGLPLRMHIVGQQFRNSPGEFKKIEVLLQQHAAAIGMQPSQLGFISDTDQYMDLLKQCDVVLSTALHDFQGLAIQEACQMACTPLAPNRLVYPEYMDREFLYECDENEAEQSTADAIIAKLMVWQKLRSKNTALPKLNLTGFSQETLRPKYAELIDQLIEPKKTEELLC